MREGIARSADGSPHSLEVERQTHTTKTPKQRAATTSSGTPCWMASLESWATWGLLLLSAAPPPRFRSPVTAVGLLASESCCLRSRTSARRRSTSDKADAGAADAEMAVGGGKEEEGAAPRLLRGVGRLAAEEGRPVVADIEFDTATGDGEMGRVVSAWWNAVRVLEGVLGEFAPLTRVLG